MSPEITHNKAPLNETEIPAKRKVARSPDAVIPTMVNENVKKYMSPVKLKEPLQPLKVLRQLSLQNVLRNKQKSEPSTRLAKRK